MTAQFDAAAQRRAAATLRIQAETGIDDAMIERLVRSFYARVGNDALLGPVFATRITDWEPHLRKMFAFWSSVMLASGRYQGQPMQAHLPLPVDAEHFDRWLALFETAVREVCPDNAADHFIEAAKRIAESLELGIAGEQDVLLRKGQRFVRFQGNAKMAPGEQID